MLQNRALVGQVYADKSSAKQPLLLAQIDTFDDPLILLS